MSGPKCYRYSVDHTQLQRQLEAERRQRELQQHQQAIAQCRAELQTLSGVLAELQTRYPGETLQLDLTPPAPPDENTVEAARRYRETLSRYLAHARADVRRLGDRAAANSAVRQLLAQLTPEVPATVRTAAEVLQARADSVATGRQAEWQRLLDRLNETDRQALPAGLLDLREAYLAAPTTAQTEALAAELRHRIQQLNQQHRQREERDAARHYAQQVIGETLTELGYDVEPGFATLFVEGGMAHIQKPEWGDYYVRLRVKPEVGDLNLNVVRVGESGHAASREQTQRDREMEETWCAAHRELLERLEARGIASRQTRALAPGELPVPTVQPEAIQQPGRARRRQTGLAGRRREH
ncbi:MAG: hypothetical protein RKO24_16975 [Candidatus Competibacter sp.]|nr:hypothetical protein [Candidatus Competibacter sp.]